MSRALLSLTVAFRRGDVHAAWFLLALLVFFAPSASAQNWEEIPPDSGTVPVRIWAGSAYDPVSNRLIVFAGAAPVPGICLGFCPATSDVFVLTNANGLGGMRDWLQLAPTGGPPPERFSPVVGYDSVSNRLIVSGGLGPVDPNTNTAFRTDTWVLTNANGLGGPPEWTQIEPGGGPPRLWAGSAYDPATNRLIVFGGEDGTDETRGICTGFTCSDPPNPPVTPATSDVFVLSNANGLGGLAFWTQLAPTGGPPPERWSPVVEHDSATNRLIVSGGVGALDPNTNTGFRTDSWVLILESLELNQPPVAEAGSPQTVQSIGPEGAPVTLDGSGSSDPDGDALTFNWTGPFPEGGGTVTGVTPTVTLPVGLSVITLVVNDGELNSTPDDVTIIVEERNQPPTAEAGPLRVVQCSSPDSTEVTLDGSASSDPVCDALTFTWTGPFSEGGGTVTGVNPTVTLPLGLSVISLVVNDGELDSAPDNVSVVVFDRVEGLLAPLASLRPEAQPPIFPDRAFRQGSTLPLKLQLFCGSTLLTDADVPPPEIVSLVRTGDAIDLEIVDLDAGQVNDSGFLFRFSDDKWVYNLSTAGLSSGTYTISIRMPDGFNRRTGFVLK